MSVVQRAFKEITAKFGISIPTDAVTAVRPCAVPDPADPSGPDELLSRAMALQQTRNPDVFVTFQYAELRDLLLGNVNLAARCVLAILTQRFDLLQVVTVK